MEQRRTRGLGKRGGPREGPPTSGIIRHDPRLRNFGSDPPGDRTLFASVGGGQLPAQPPWPLIHAQFLDVICVNEYFGFYSKTGLLDTVRPAVSAFLENWHNKHNKPIMVSEYGADSMDGLHLLPSAIWSEDYQSQMMEEQFKGFDDARGKGAFAGEMIWNFADFMTDQSECLEYSTSPSSASYTCPW
ncbi:hypothetical protein PR048_020583 [Dryococelus australis]|uniref:Glycoside hydrolase family 2 catalytic domain-containing protein n=1 Tax=Dryococelus australis TaxID=614101 RepID=A0ABQ9H6N5_9NEOP|nr:hypothetical protein PR048_020583 [Dryococelus australis]